MGILFPYSSSPGEPHSDLSLFTASTELRTAKQSIFELEQKLPLPESALVSSEASSAPSWLNKR